MKRFILLVLCLTTVFALACCTSSNNNESSVLTETPADISSTTSSDSANSSHSSSTVGGVETPDAPYQEWPVAQTTYNVTVTENENGTVTVTATLPANIESGKIVVCVSDSLTIIKDTLKCNATGQVVVNEEYKRNGLNGACAVFASTTANAEGTVAFTADYTVAEGATVTETDITVPEWNVAAKSIKIGTQKDGKVNLTFIPLAAGSTSAQASA